MTFAAQIHAPRTPRTPHEAAFGHYLRTGERLTTAEWLARQEVKFNPWHDRLGRFTYGPDGGVSGGAAPNGRGGGMPPPAQPRASGHAAAGRASGISASHAPPDGAGRTPPASAGNGFRSDLVRNAVAPQTSTAETYFELNRRQAALDRLRAQAGRQPAPAIAADLADFQTRLDANRALLDARYQVADRQIGEILRAGLAPFDVAAGVGKVASGQGELRDYLAASQVVPLGAALDKIGQLGKLAARGAESTVAAAEPAVPQLGGAYRWVKARQPKGSEAHHLISKAISPLRDAEGPAITMPVAHHKRTKSWGSSQIGKGYRRRQARVLRVLGIRAAMEFEARRLRKEFGALYDEALAQAEAYAKHMGYKSWISSFILSRA